ncbi:hypothetical protein [Sulfitobacter sp. S190]|uniref:hypothetical protein n=1 Tax=Sulfitobacter sp. S190 TaxID=2867022 RepID=UPI0021A73E3F|nr:hypothetical protein [Sulfitobacter sp. S190]UWR21214.1 hypothetical protein K3756_10845 [Sulfitobacter sp. S190]
MTLSALPILFGLQLGFLCAMGLTARSFAAVITALIVGFVLSIWASASAIMAVNGVYESDRFLALLPGLWLPVVPFALGFAALTVPMVRKGLLDMCAATPDHWFVAIQALRIAAVGTLIKTVQGDFPLEVELAIGVTDLAFGLSALWLFFKARRSRISADALGLWHIVGVLIIIVPGLIAIQTGLPGPMRVFSEYPTSEVMLDWPMVLAPSLVVPNFLLLNVLAAFAAYRRRVSGPTERTIKHG